jgi:TatD DNase family protein
LTATLVDTHCHLDDARFAADVDAVVERAAAAGVTRAVIPATSVAGARAALALAARHAGLRVAVGVHPLWCATHGSLSEAIAQLRDLAQAPPVVAIGEIGLDYYRGPDPALQERWLDAQLDLAAAAGLPVILHNREATGTLLERLRAWGQRAALPKPPGVLHAFSAGRAAADFALGAGFYLGIGGMLTFRRADEVRAVAAAAPADRLVLETDAPYLAPEPVRGRRNEPALLRHVAARLAALRATDIEHIALQTTGNAARLFPRLTPEGVR